MTSYVPNLRFPEFQGEWEKKSLGEIGDSFIGLTYKPTDVVSEGGLIVFRSSNIQNGCMDYKDIVRVNKNVKEKLITKKDDLLVCARNGSARLIGKNAILHEADANQTFGAFMMVFRSDKNHFVHQLLNTRRYSSQVSENLGARINQITSSDLSSFEFFFPTENSEMNKIAALLDLLDERIVTQNKIIDKLKSLIKGISKQLLMNNQNWRTVRIGELLRIGNGKDYKHLGIGKIPVYGTGGQMLLVNDYLYDGESVCIGRKGTIDTPMFLNGKFWTVDTLFYTYDFKDVLPKFCYYLFLQINWKLYNEGTGVPSLSKSTIENIKVKIPSIEQQHNICSVLDCYEHKTKSEEQILELYLSEKQYLLRQMFI